MTVIDNKTSQQFELLEDDHLCFAKYRREDGPNGLRILILHVEAPAPLRGTGAAGRLMQGLHDLAQSEGAQLVPVCPYAVHWLAKYKGH